MSPIGRDVQFVDVSGNFTLWTVDVAASGRKKESPIKYTLMMELWTIRCMFM